VTRSVRTINESKSNRLALGIAEAADSVGVSAGFLRLEIARGRLKSSKCGRRVLLTPGDLENWLREGAGESRAGTKRKA
jgi:excisionase family DNA binding protein